MTVLSQPVIKQYNGNSNHVIIDLSSRDGSFAREVPRNRPRRYQAFAVFQLYPGIVVRISSSADGIVASENIGHGDASADATAYERDVVAARPEPWPGQYDPRISASSCGDASVFPRPSDLPATAHRHHLGRLRERRLSPPRGERLEPLLRLFLGGIQFRVSEGIRPHASNGGTGVHGRYKVGAP